MIGRAATFLALGLGAAVVLGALSSSEILPFATGIIVGGCGVQAVQHLWRDRSSLRRLPVLVATIAVYGVAIAAAVDPGRDLWGMI